LLGCNIDEWPLKVILLLAEDCAHNSISPVLASGCQSGEILCEYGNSTAVIDKLLRGLRR